MSSRSVPVMWVASAPLSLVLILFFFEQKTAYEMRIIDWSSDVCSSDLMTYQFHVANGKLSGLLFQRSCDLGLGFAFNVFSAALLIRMLAQQCDMEAGELVWNGGDVHLYLNHAVLVEEQLSRIPCGAPTLHLARRPTSIFDYRIEDFEVRNYHPQSHIPAPVAV